MRIEKYFPVLFFWPSPPPSLVSLTLTFLLALPPTQYEGNRLNEEVSEGEEGMVLSALYVFPPPFVGVQIRRWASDDGPQPSVPRGHENSPSCIV